MAKAPDHGVRAIAAIAERMLKDLPDHPTALRLQSEVNKLRNGAEALDKVRANRSPLDTREAHALKVGKLAKQFESEAIASLNRSIQYWAEGYDDIERRIAQKVDLTPNAFAQEIRSAFRTLSRKDKIELLGQLVKENRGPELAAIVKAPSVLSGISDDERAKFEESIIGMHASAEIEERAKLEDVFNAMNRAQDTASNIVKRFRDPAQLADIERAAADADAAGDAFTQSMQ